MWLSGCKKPWKIPRLYSGETVFILGSGPSLGRLQGKDYLRNKNVIACHCAFFIGDFVDILFMADARCYWTFPQQIDNFKGLKVSLNIQVPGKYESIENLSNIKVINTIMKGDNRVGLSKLSTCVSYNGSCGGAAIDFACHLGAKRIVLYGFDFNSEAENLGKQFFQFSHTQGDLVHKWAKSSVWGRLVYLASKRNISLVNASPNNSLKTIPSVNLKDEL